MSKKYRDPIEDLNEWQEHMYNPGHWVNRFPPHFPPKPSIGFWILSMIDVILIVPAFILLTIQHVFGKKMPGGPILIGFYGIFSLFSILRAIRLKPGKKDSIPQEIRDEIRRKQNRDRKKNLPKRRKDYG